MDDDLSQKTVRSIVCAGRHPIKIAELRSPAVFDALSLYYLSI